MKLGRMGNEPVEPGELVGELRARLRVAVRQVDARDEHPVDRCLDVAALRVLGIAGQFVPDQDGLCACGGAVLARTLRKEFRPGEIDLALC
jgi:hypothetical protein